MDGIEFFLDNDKLWYRKDNKIFEFGEDADFLGEIFAYINNVYPEAMSALQKEYEKSSLNTRYFQYLCVRRFCKCNFSLLDNTNVDYKVSVLNLEKVYCPLRGECKFEGVICMPKADVKMSEAEKRVMDLIYHGKSVSEVAEDLFLSPNTIKNHIKSVYTKLNIHKISDFINYANRHNLFTN